MNLIFLAAAKGSLLAWSQLFRISATPSAASNILAGFLIANGQWQPIGHLIGLVASSCLFYTSGMVLNDICDYEYDCQHRERRPLPSRRITMRAAWTAYAILTLLGLVTALLVGLASLAVAICLVLAILGYNKLLKATYLAPAAMGFCRFLNILLGASSVESLTAGPIWPVVGVASSISIFVIGLTWFARNESGISSQTKLASSASVIGLGVLGLVAVAGVMLSEGSVNLQTCWGFWGLLVAICLPIAVRIAAAINRPQPTQVQVAVATMIRSLILYDAAICFLFAQGEWLYPMVTVSLVIPSVVLSRWAAST